jgi:predicted permease
MLRRLLLALRTIFLRRRLEREMQEEMASHLAQSTERLLARGLTRAEAGAAARREFGSVAYWQEQARDARGARWVESILADLRFGLRHFGRTPFSTLTMIVLLALGIGFNTALFTVFYSLVNMPPPGIARSETLVRIRGIDRSSGRVLGREFSYPEYREYAAQRTLFSAVAAWTSSDVVLDVGERQESLHSAAATYVTAGYFPVLGVRPVLGAGLPPSTSDRGEPQVVAVISHPVWDRYFGKAPDIIGKTVKVNEVAVTIVGVAPRRFAGARTGGSQMRLWLPLNARPLLQRTSALALSSYDSAALGLVARLRPGIEATQTIPTVQAIAARAAQQTRTRAAISTDVVTLLDNYFPPSGERPSVVGRLTSLLIPLLILVLPCTNVSALLAGLAVARRREIAVRLSLGAPRRRIVRQLVTESVLLALAAAVLGLCVILILLKVFGARLPDTQLVVHWPAISFTFGLAIATGIGFGVSPALHATRVAVADILKDSATAVASARARLQSGLVVALIALTQPLLLGLGTLTLELVSDLQRLPVPASADRIMQVSFNTNPRYGALDQKREDVLQQLQVRLTALPGVDGVVAQQASDPSVQVTVHPSDRMTGRAIEEPFWLRTSAAPPGYFSLMGFPLVRGREFTHSDRHDERALVIRSDLARRLWGPADPIGRRLVHAAAGQGEATAFVVVGVVDETSTGSSGDHDQHAYVATLRNTGSFLIRTRGPAQPMMAQVRSVALAEAPALPVTRVTTLAAIEAQQRALIAKESGGVIAGGVVALLLCAIGLYTVVAFAVGQRTREIGIRTALGADSRQVVSVFFFKGLRLSFVGLLIGFTLSIILQRLMALAEGNDPTNGTTLLAILVAATMVGVSSLATWIPARRAARVDPLLTLRAE